MRRRNTPLWPRCAGSRADLEIDGELCALARGDRRRRQRDLAGQIDRSGGAPGSRPATNSFRLDRERERSEVAAGMPGIDGEAVRALARVEEEGTDEDPVRVAV